MADQTLTPAEARRFRTITDALRTRHAPGSVIEVAGSGYVIDESGYPTNPPVYSTGQTQIGSSAMSAKINPV